MKKILVLVFSNLKHDARVSRQVQWLKKKYAVTVICFDSEDIPEVTIVRVPKPVLTITRKACLALALITRQYKMANALFHNYHQLLRPFKNKHYDLVVANDIDTLPFAFWLKPPRVLFDAHEYAPRHFENNKVWKIFFQPFYLALCRRYIPKVDAMLTVGEGLANEYEKHFGVKPVIITNATRYHNVRPSPVEPHRIRLIHHGIANESRRLELMIEMMEHLDDRFSLDLMLMTSEYASAGTKKYIQRLTDTIKNDRRITVLPPVKSHQVVEAITPYDIGIFLIPPVNFNYANTLPNKLFDYIQARLGVAIGPTPEMASIVHRWGNGVVADNFEPISLAEKLNNLTQADIVRFKNQSAVAAENLNAEKNERIFNQVLTELL